MPAIVQCCMPANTSRYEPVENRSYGEFAEHHCMSVVPSRTHKPRDRAKAEAGVLVEERRILAPLNAAIREKLDELS